MGAPRDVQDTTRMYLYDRDIAVPCTRSLLILPYPIKCNLDPDCVEVKPVISGERKCIENLYLASLVAWMTIAGSLISNTLFLGVRISYFALVAELHSYTRTLRSRLNNRGIFLAVVRRGTIPHSSRVMDFVSTNREKRGGQCGQYTRASRFREHNYVLLW